MVHHFCVCVTCVLSKNFDSIRTKLAEQIHFELCPYGDSVMALLQQHDARRDIVIEPAARRRAAIESRGHSELRAFGTGGVRNWGRNRAIKTTGLSHCFSVCQTSEPCENG